VTGNGEMLRRAWRKCVIELPTFSVKTLVGKLFFESAL